MAVAEDRQGHGIGRALVEAAIALAVERDAFTEATGYEPGLRIDGIELHDRVWLDRRIDGQDARRP